MINWKRKLTSRKLWVAIAGFVSGLMIYAGRSESEASQVGGLIMSAAAVIGYLIGEGLADSSPSDYPSGEPPEEPGEVD
jgi:hypothetical protein